MRRSGLRRAAEWEHLFSACRSNGKLCALVKTITFSRLIVTAYDRPTLVNCALHRVSVQCRAPAIVKAAHHPSFPLVLDGKFNRNILIVAHQHDLQPATASRTIAARDDQTVVCIISCFHIGIVPCCGPWSLDHHLK
jgi:hypothetical protein